jgi:hypothetical protein
MNDPPRSRKVAGFFYARAQAAPPPPFLFSRLPPRQLLQAVVCVDAAPQRIRLDLHQLLQAVVCLGPFDRI